MKHIPRPLALAGGEPVDVRVILDGEVIVLYVNERVALTTAANSTAQAGWGVFVTDGQAKFRLGHAR